MQKKYYYQEGLCPLCHYNGLFPVVYEKTPDGYKKQSMDCSLIREGKCAAFGDCPVFSEAMDQVPGELEWKLREKRLGN